MDASDFIVEYRDITLQRKGQIPVDDLSLKFQPVFNGVGSWSLQLPAEHRAVPYLREPGSGIIITNALDDDVLMSGPTSKPTKRATAADPKGMVTIAGISDDCILWDSRIWPNPGAAVNAQTSAYSVSVGSAESVMRGLVNVNIGPGAAAFRRGILASQLTLGVNLNRGPAVTRTERFSNLGDVLREIASLAGLKFRIVQRGSFLVYEVSDVRDRTKFIVLDIENGTLDEQSVEFAPPKSTRVLVAGQGEGEARTLIERSSVESRAAEALWGRRMETFKDQRNTDDMTELQQSGDEILEKDGFTRTSVKAIPSNDVTMKYPEDWREGDSVTVVVEDQPRTSTVTEAAFIVDKNGVMIGAAIGDVSEFDSSSAMRQDVNDTQRRVEALERTSDKGTGGPSWNDIVGKPGTFPPSAHTNSMANITGITGTIMLSAAATTPTGFLTCQGQAVSRTTYSALYTALGGSSSPYGQGNGSTTFNVPDLRGKVPVGVSSGETEFNIRGKEGGTKTHTLTTPEMPAHTHSYNRPEGIYNVNPQVATSPRVSAIAVGVPTGSAGGGEAHNNLQPYIALNYIIKT